MRADAAAKEKAKADALRSVVELAAAVRVQAWWRGLMVRHKLGPFKGSGGKKSAKKGKKGKKGKKK